MTLPLRVKDLLTNFEKTISKNDEMGVSSGVYLTAQLMKRKPSIRKSSPSVPRQSLFKQGSIGAFSTSTASETASYHESGSFDETCDSYCSSKHRVGSTARFLSQARKLGNVDEENDCIGFTVAYRADNDFIIDEESNVEDDDNTEDYNNSAFILGNSSGSFRLSQSLLCPNDGDCDKSISSAISATPSRIREQPRDLEFDDSTDSESESEEFAEEARLCFPIYNRTSYAIGNTMLAGHVAETWLKKETDR